MLHLPPVFRVVEAAGYWRHRPAIARLQANQDLKLHLGCGPRLLPGWVNIDMEWRRGVWPQKLPRGLRWFAPDSVKCIYSSHFFEHLDYPEPAGELARQCHRVLVPGGTLRLVVPGIEKIIRAYVADDAEFFHLQAALHPPDCTTKLEHLMYALQQDGQHRYGYDFPTLEKLLLRAGFAQVRLSDHNRSPVPDLQVDYRGVRDAAGNYISLYVEAVKTSSGAPAAVCATVWGAFTRPLKVVGGRFSR